MSDDDDGKANVGNDGDAENERPDYAGDVPAASAAAHDRDGHCDHDNAQHERSFYWLAAKRIPLI